MHNYKNITKLLFEICASKNVRNVGWQLIGAKNGSSLAEHGYLNAVIALILAQMEKSDNPQKCALGALFHKLHKVRLGDRHKVSANYLDYPPEVKKKIHGDQMSLLDKNTRKSIESTISLSNEEKVIVKDADQIVLALEAKEYIDQGIEKAAIWIERIEKAVKTNSAKKIVAQIKTTHSCDWLKDLKKDVQKKERDYISKV